MLGKKIKLDPVVPNKTENQTETEKDLEKKERQIWKALKAEIKKGIPDRELFERLLGNRETIRNLREKLYQERGNR